jgi:membrane fusion protein, multidrug efflux system
VTEADPAVGGPTRVAGTRQRRRRRAGRVVFAVVVVVLAVGAAAAAATGFRLEAGPQGGDRQASADGGRPPATEKVTRQTLVEAQTQAGTLGYGDKTTVSGRLGGTVTGLPATGSTIKRGQALHRFDNAPVMLLYGSLPAYRALAVGTEGADVKQFERNLYALGYRGFTVDRTYSEATADAVKQWQDDLGLPETGTVELGRVVYAAGPVRVGTHEAAVGDAVQPGAALFTITGRVRVVTVELDTADQRLARKGAAVKVTLPDGKTVGGKIAKTQTVIDTGSGDGSGGGGGGGGGSDPETKIEVTVTIADQKALAGLDQASVDVGFTASQRKNVLSVPGAALLALAEGGYGVQVVDGTSTRIVAVETGLFAGGRVEVSGAGLKEGMTVGMPA